MQPHQTTDTELRHIEGALKDWFLTRRVRLERALSLQRLFQEHHVSGLNDAAPSPATLREKAMWDDLRRGVPHLEPSLSQNAKAKKADLYLSIFKTATDLDHDCRKEGVDYLYCLRATVENAESDTQGRCTTLFDTFDACRKQLYAQQQTNIAECLKQQQAEDSKALQLWQRRHLLRQTCNSAKSFSA